MVSQIGGVSVVFSFTSLVKDIVDFLKQAKGGIDFSRSGGPNPTGLAIALLQGTSGDPGDLLVESSLRALGFTDVQIQQLIHEAQIVRESSVKTDMPPMWQIDP